MTTGEIKKYVIDVITKIIFTHQKNRSDITMDIYNQFMSMNVIPEHRKYFEYYCDKYVNINIR